METQIVPGLQLDALKGNYSALVKTMKKIQFGQKNLIQLIEKNVIPSTKGFQQDLNLLKLSLNDYEKKFQAEKKIYLNLQNKMKKTHVSKEEVQKSLEKPKHFSTIAGINV